MLIFLDLETTGLEEVDKICSIGLIAVDDDEIVSKYNLVNEGKKISSKASSINHLTNEMLKGMPKLKDSEAYKFLNENNNDNNTLIAHNAKYDLKMLDACGFEWHGDVIDTLRCSKHLIQECEQFSLQFLRYELKLYRAEEKEAKRCALNEKVSSHNAISDALHVKLLYEYLLDIATHEKLVELTLKNVLIQKFDFGKYSGRYLEDICMNDRGYLEWMLGNIMDLDEDLRYSIEYNLRENG